MKDRDATCFVSAGLCIAVALLRMLAPGLPFDVMTFALILVAAMVPVILHLAKAPGAADGDRAAAVIPEMAALRVKMAQIEGKRGEGELPKALNALRADHPFAAMCAARGLLAMLQQSGPTETEGEGAAMALLIAAMDAAAMAGESSVDRETTDALFQYALAFMD